MSSDLRARLEQLMAWDDNAINDQYESMGNPFGERDDAIDLAAWQHARDLEVLRKMAAVIERFDQVLNSMEYPLDKVHWCKAEIARLVSE